jgi:hypothetical protein
MMSDKTKNDRRRVRRGLCYLLCFRRPEQPDTPARYHHAGHYVGFVASGDEKDLEARLNEHRSGRGARLVEVIQGAGFTFAVSRVWRDATRDDERRIHRQSGSYHCPTCRGFRRAAGALLARERTPSARASQ